MVAPFLYTVTSPERGMSFLSKPFEDTLDIVARDCEIDALMVPLKVEDLSCAWIAACNGGQEGDLLTWLDDLLLTRPANTSPTPLIM